MPQLQRSNVRRDSEPAPFKRLKRMAAPKKQQTHPECISVSQTSACAPLTTGLTINTTALEQIYGPGITAASWNRDVLAETDGGKGELNLFTSILSCTSGTTAASATDVSAQVRYLRTILCIRDLFVLSSGCNSGSSVATTATETLGIQITSANNSIPPAICKKTCYSFNETFSNALQQNDCLVVDENKDMFLVDSCITVTAGQIFSSPDPCMVGVTDDLNNCEIYDSLILKTR
ncbi:hypothetical protein HK100_002174 [Physocladia obscura]|uniref:Uncharacterized protein n=1 Tax=Physocladia obscura TaxID=109957 RepID=A0AAD5SW30_9FUNG|nr:hypothetical protein HK100_002174 [Physocladia obscura]